LPTQITGTGAVYSAGLATRLAVALA